MTKNYLLLSATILLATLGLRAQSLSAPDIYITEENVGKCIEVPLTLTMPEGGDFVNIEIRLFYPEGLEPAQDEYGGYCYVGDDVAKDPRTGAAYVTFQNNCDVPGIWPNYIYVGANITKTPTTTNPCEVVVFNVKTIADNIDDVPFGTLPFMAYVRYIQSDDQSFTIGNRTGAYDFSPVQLCNVVYPGIKAEIVSLSNETLNLYVGEQSTLTASVSPNVASQNVKWASSKSAVATVDSNGLVRAVSDGVAVITATTTDGTNLTAACIVTVERPMATGIELDEREMTLFVGEQGALTATVFPGNASQQVAWSSNNEDVVAVGADGVLTALSRGRARITATTTDGSNLSSGCLVTVRNVAIRGDANEDGNVDIDDLNLIVNLIVYDVPWDTYSTAADLNADGRIDIDDVNVLVNIMLDLE